MANEVEPDEPVTAPVMDLAADYDASSLSIRSHVR